MLRSTGIPGLQRLRDTIFSWTQYGGPARAGSETNAISTSQHLPRDENASEQLVYDAEVPSNNMSDFTALCRTLVLEMGRLKNQRQRSQLLYTQKANEMQKYTDKRRFLVESLLEISDAEMDDAFTKLIALLDESVAKSRAGLRAQLAGDAEAFMEQTRSLMDVERSAISLDSRVVDTGNKVWGVLEQIVRALPNGETMLSNIRASAEDVRSRRSSASEVLPSPAREYFSAKADLSLLRDQLVDLQNRHAQEKSSREVARDQGRENQPSDDVFESAYHEDLEVLQVKLQEAEDHQAELAHACQKAGLDIDELRLRGLPDDEYPSTPYIADVPFPLPPFETGMPHWYRNSLVNSPYDAQAESPSGDLDCREEVQTWLTTVAEPEEDVDYVRQLAERPQCNDWQLRSTERRGNASDARKTALLADYPANVNASSPKPVMHQVRQQRETGRAVLGRSSSVPNLWHDRPFMA